MSGKFFAISLLFLALGGPALGSATFRSADAEELKPVAELLEVKKPEPIPFEESAKAPVEVTKTEITVEQIKTEVKSSEPTVEEVKKPEEPATEQVKEQIKNDPIVIDQVIVIKEEDAPAAPVDAAKSEPVVEAAGKRF